MKVLLLGTRRQELIDFLASCGDEAIATEEKITSKSDLLQDVDFLVSYGYRHILKKDVLDKFLNHVINIHISLLPWNRGADPNLWSFLENTPKGVTIHYMDCGVDTGDILIQQEIYFSEEETLRTSYDKLAEVAQNLFKKYWVDIRDGKIKSTPQASGGSYHRLCDRVPYKYLLIKGWDTPVSELTGKALAKE